MKKYDYIADQLYQRIINNEFNETQKIPTEDQLINEYNVSRNTIRSAIKILTKMGLLYPVQGSGLFIKPPQKPDTVYLSSTQGVTADHDGKTIVNQLIDFKLLEADEALAKRMLCQIGTPIYYIIRLRIVDSIPYAVEYTYYNKEIVPYMGHEIVEGSIFDYLKNDLKLSFGFADKYISAAKLNANDSQLLQLNEGDPSIVIEDNVHLNNGVLFNSSKIIYNYQLANFYMVAQ